GFAASAVEAWLNSRFAPATRAGAPVESRLPAKLVFGVEGSQGLAGIEAVARARERADAGDADAAYTTGLAATLDASLGISSARRPRAPNASLSGSTWRRCLRARRWARCAIPRRRSAWRSSLRRGRFRPTRRCSRPSRPLTRPAETSAVP